MEYRAGGSRAAAEGEASFTTSDGKVTATSAPYKWALGKRVDAVLTWCRGKWMAVYVRDGAAGKWRRLP